MWVAAFNLLFQCLINSADVSDGDSLHSLTLKLEVLFPHSWCLCGFFWHHCVVEQSAPISCYQSSSQWDAVLCTKNKKRKVRRTRGLWRKYIRILFLYSNPKVKKNSSSVQPSKQKFLRGKKLVIPTLNELHLQIKFLIMLGTSEPPAGGSPVQEPVNKKPTSSMFV